MGEGNVHKARVFPLLPVKKESIVSGTGKKHGAAERATPCLFLLKLISPETIPALYVPLDLRRLAANLNTPDELRCHLFLFLEAEFRELQSPGQNRL